MSCQRYSVINGAVLCLFFKFVRFHPLSVTMKSVLFVRIVLNFNKSKNAIFVLKRYKKVELRELVVPL